MEDQNPPDDSLNQPSERHPGNSTQRRPPPNPLLLAPPSNHTHGSPSTGAPAANANANANANPSPNANAGPRTPPPESSSSALGTLGPSSSLALGTLGPLTTPTRPLPSPTTPIRPLPSPLGSLRLNRLRSPASSTRSFTGSVASAHSASSSFVANSFAYGLYSSGPTRPLPSVRLPEDIEAGALPGLINFLAPGQGPGGQTSDSRAEELLSSGEEEKSLGLGSDYGLKKMPLGILNTRDGMAPGTVLAATQDTRKGKQSSTGAAVAGSMSVEQVLDERLKYDRTGKQPILLVPQPSDDPNDPLNWPRWRRDIVLCILSFMSVIASTLSPLLAADTVSLFIDFATEGDPGRYNFTDMALLTGYHLLGVGLAGFLFVASARIWGKRHLYLLGCLLIIVSSAWGGATGINYGSLLAARVLQGIGLAPFEALVNASVTDLYFVHERGSRMAISNMALFGGAFFTPVIVGKLSFELGWQWSFYLVAIFAGICFPLLFFFVPETAFRRDESPIVVTDPLDRPQIMEQTNGATNGNIASADRAFSEPANGTTTEPLQDTEKGALGSSSSGSGRKDSAQLARPQKMSYARSLLPFSGRKSDDPFWKLVLRPFPLFLHPGVLWACLTQGAIIGWTVLIGVVLAALFVGPPLFFSEVQTGYMYAGPFVGALIGFLLAGFLADWSYKLMTRWNGGIYEPEFRILLVIPQLILGCAGLYGFGAASSGTDHGWFVPTFCFALEVAGMVVGAVASALYIADAHQEIAVEAFTCLLIFKNLFSFGLTYGAFDWLSLNGTSKVFVIIGSVQVAICLLSVPMYIFGKRNRAFFGRHNILEYCGLW